MLSAPLPGKRNDEYTKAGGGRKRFLKKNESVENRRGFKHG
jgi:hypothetical protein